MNFLKKAEMGTFKANVGGVTIQVPLNMSAAVALAPREDAQKRRLYQTYTALALNSSEDGLFALVSDDSGDEKILMRWMARGSALSKSEGLAFFEADGNALTDAHRYWLLDKEVEFSLILQEMAQTIENVGPLSEDNDSAELILSRLQSRFVGIATNRASTALPDEIGQYIFSGKDKHNISSEPMIDYIVSRIDEAVANKHDEAVVIHRMISNDILEKKPNGAMTINDGLAASPKVVEAIARHIKDRPDIYSYSFVENADDVAMAWAVTKLMSTRHLSLQDIQKGLPNATLKDEKFKNGVSVFIVETEKMIRNIGKGQISPADTYYIAGTQGLLFGLAACSDIGDFESLVETLPSNGQWKVGAPNPSAISEHTTKSLEGIVSAAQCYEGDTPSISADTVVEAFVTRANDSQQAKTNSELDAIQKKFEETISPPSERKPAPSPSR